MPMLCSLNPMEEHRAENLWSERFQDLGSWCHQHQDELHTPQAFNSNELDYSFDEQSMYYSWELNSSSVDHKIEEMWKPQPDLSSLQYNPDEDNNNSLMHTFDDKGTDTGFRYSANMVLTTEFLGTPCTKLDQDLGNCQNNTKSTCEIPELNNTSSVLNITTSDQNNMKITPSIGMTSTMMKPKTSLKLNIAAAREPITSNDTPTAPILSLNTPDVCKQILDDTTFNLLDFIENNDDQNLIAVNPASILSQRPKEVESVAQEIIKTDHDYAEPNSLEEPVSCQAFVSDETLPFIKEENECTVFKPIAIKEEPDSPMPSGSNLGKRIRRPTNNSDDFIFNEDPQSDESSDWLPTAKKKIKIGKKRISSPIKQQVKRVRTSSLSDSGSVTSGPDRYRELRDRNNEASRRSRQNRKQRESELMEQHNGLQRKNEYLKSKAISLEKRVKSLREILMKVVLAKNKMLTSN